jgi:hypothetical protein
MTLLQIVLCIFALKFIPMKNNLLLVFLLMFSVGFSQVQKGEKPNKAVSLNEVPEKAPKATFNQYRIITLQRDTTYVDTSLTIKKEYEYNYLRKDIFGLLPFANEGQTYAVLDYGLKSFTSFPEIGFSGKQFNYLGVKDINYYDLYLNT